MYRHKAKDRTRRAQIAVGALVLGAVAVVAVPANLIGGDKDAVMPAAVPPASVRVASAAPPSTMDAADLAKSFERISPPPPVVPKAAEPDDPPSTPPPPAATPPAPWRYIGVVLGQTRGSHRAIVASLKAAAEGQPPAEGQAMLREGDRVDTDRIDEIHGTYLLVSNPEGQQRRVEMAVQAKPLLVVAAPVAPTTPDSLVNAAMEAGANDEQMTELKTAIENGEFSTYVDPSMGSIKTRSPREVAQMLMAGQLRNAKFARRSGEGLPGAEGQNPDDLSVFTRMQRAKIQALDEAQQNGTINGDQFRKLSQQVLGEGAPKGTPEQFEQAEKEWFTLQQGGGVQIPGLGTLPASPK